MKIITSTAFCFAWRILLSLLILSIHASLVCAEETDKAYQLGRGYPLGDSGLALGGYASSHIEALGKSPASFSLSNISLFVTWDNGGKLRFFSETEGENVLNVGGKRTLSSSVANLHIERLYIDYLATNSLSVRIGKILTPVGQWNLIHVDPLVWTTSRPVATTNLFSDYATGLMLQGNVLVDERLLEYSVYSDYSSALDPTRTDTPAFDNAQGLRLRYHVHDGLQLGLSYADFALIDRANFRNHLAGLDLSWSSSRRYALNSEIVYRNNAAEINRNAWQGYFQGVAPIGSSLYLVGRYEFFDWEKNRYDHSASKSLGQAEVIGIAYRPQPPLVFKLEYRTGHNNQELAPDGLFASCSVLF